MVRGVGARPSQAFAEVVVKRARPSIPSGKKVREPEDVFYRGDDARAIVL